jgi:superfamily II DNA or RNA helicase
VKESSLTALDALRTHPDPAHKGREFERLAERYLHVAYLASNVHRPDQDLGVDRLFIDQAGRLCAAQMKCYAPNQSVKYHHINNFVRQARAEGAEVLVLLTTGPLSPNAAKVIEAEGIIVHGYEALAAADCWDDQALVGQRLEPLAMRPHQQVAYQAARAMPGVRGQVIMPCRTGKSLVEAELAAAHATSVVFVPTMALATQMAQDIRRQLPDRPMLVLYSGEEVQASTEWPVPATTNQQVVKVFRADHSEYVIVSTYHSAGVLAGGPTFDLMVCDEAHRLATNSLVRRDVDAGFKVVLDDAQVPAQKRVFFTATPRNAAPSVKGMLRNAGMDIYSMDDPSVFGDRVHEMTWSSAVSEGLILPLEVVAMLANDASLAARIEANGWTDALAKYTIDAAGVRDVAAVLGVLDAHKRYGITTMLTYHGSRRKAHAAEELTRAVASLMGLEVETLTVTYKSSKVARRRAMEMLAPGGSTLRIVFSVQMFTEGVNTPALDAVVYFEPKRSVVSIAQSLARPVTRDDATGKTHAYAILPVFAESADGLEAAIDASHWAGVRSVARAMFAFGMTPEQMDVQVQEPDRVVGGNGGPQPPITLTYLYDDGFALDKAKEHIRSAVLDLAPNPHPNGSPCPVVMDDGVACGRPVHANGMCTSHNYRQENGLPLGQPWNRSGYYGEPCSIVMDDGTECGKPIGTRGMCAAHNYRRRTGASMTVPWPLRTKGQPCPVPMDDGTLCGKPIRYGGMCQGHNNRKKKSLPMGEPWGPKRRWSGTCPIEMDDGSLCGRPVKFKGMCSGHYGRQKTGTSMGKPWVIRGETGKPCPIIMDDGSPCGRPIVAKRMCQGHWSRSKNGSPLGEPWVEAKGLSGKPCPVQMDDGRACGKPIVANGMCQGHDQRHRKGAAMGKPWREVTRGLTGTPCPVAMDDGSTCGRPVAAKGMCARHRYRSQQGRPMGAPWPSERVKPDACPIEMDDGNACGRPVVSNGICSGHKQRKAMGTPMGQPWAKRDGSTGKPCPVTYQDGETCGRPIAANGMCQFHYDRYRKGQPLDLPPGSLQRKPRELCGITMDDGSTCSEPVYGNGMCKRHYARARDGRPMGSPWRRWTRNKGNVCSVQMDDGTACGEPASVRGFCKRHYARYEKGRPLGAPWE